MGPELPGKVGVYCADSSLKAKGPSILRDLEGLKLKVQVKPEVDFMIQLTKTGWWFQIFLEFSPLFGEDSQFD